MKLLLLLLSFGFVHHPETRFILIDRQLKKPAIHSEQFTFDQYIGRTFPVYSGDVTAVIAAAELVAKKLEQKMECGQSDTVNANHTCFIITSTCHPYNSVSVRLLTSIEEQRISCGLELIQKQDNYRKAQRVLLDFSSYLAAN